MKLEKANRPDFRQQVENLKNEIGKPSPVRGRKVRAAAIRFQEHFEWRVFTSGEFNEWAAGEDVLAPLMAANASLARRRLQAAGFRDDMPQPFEIIRIGRSGFQLRPPQEYITSGDIPQAVVDYIKKVERKMQKALQACDLDAQDPFSRFAIVQLYRQYKGAKTMTLSALSIMQETIDSLDTSGEFLQLGNRETAGEDGNAE